MAFNTLLLETAQDVAVLTLNRPDKLNSFTTEMHGELRQALSEVAEKKARALILTGAGRAFSAGQDLSDRAMTAKSGEPFDLGKTIDQLYNPLVRQLKALPCPTVAAVNGIAAGAGCNLALACDLVLAAKSASFMQAFCKIGLIPDSGGTWTLPHLVGRARALGLALLGDKLPAEKAEEWGLIWRTVEDGKLMDEARALAAHLAAQPTMALTLIREAIDKSTAQTLDQQLDLERDLQKRCGLSEDYREGVLAFFEKRPAKFRGR